MGHSPPRPVSLCSRKYLAGFFFFFLMPLGDGAEMLDNAVEALGLFELLGCPGAVQRLTHSSDLAPEGAIQDKPWLWRPVGCQYAFCPSPVMENKCIKTELWVSIICKIGCVKLAYSALIFLLEVRCSLLNTHWFAGSEHLWALLELWLFSAASYLVLFFSCDRPVLEFCPSKASNKGF